MAEQFFPSKDQMLRVADQSSRVADQMQRVFGLGAWSSRNGCIEWSMNLPLSSRQVKQRLTPRTKLIRYIRAILWKFSDINAFNLDTPFKSLILFCTLSEKELVRALILY